MDSSFLTFSPKALSKKKLYGNIVQGPVRSRLLKTKVHPLQDVRCSPSSHHNIEKNRKESIDSKKSSSVAHDDSIIVISEKINRRADLQYVSKTISSEQRSTQNNSTLVSKNVKRNQVSADDKFNEIRTWLNELHTAHERKRLSSPWTPLNSSSVIECSPIPHDPPKLDTKSTSKTRISETSSDESLESMQKDLPDSNSNNASQESGKEDKEVKSESSDENKTHVRRKKVCIIYSDSECDGSSNHSRLSSMEKKSTTDLMSNRSSEDSFKLSVPHNTSDHNGRYSGTSVQSDNSIISVSSAERILSNLYSKNWNKETVLTPVLERRKIVTKKPSSEEEAGSFSATLSQLYGKSWNEEKVLTPLLNRRKQRKGKENTPPINKKIVKKDSIFLTPKTPVTKKGTSAPKTYPNQREALLIAKSPETFSFLRSLSVCSPKKCNPEALLYKKQFKKNKDELCSRLFKLFNAQVFENKLPFNLRIEWNAHMTRTAGFCRNSSIIGSQGRIRSSRIELSTKVCNTADRVRDTLIHELCHAATWIVDGIKNGHGAVWQSWTMKAMARYPELPRIGRCHSYSIETKYTYRCKNCGYSFGRHSKSLDLQRKRCGYCYGEFDLLVNTKPKNADSGVQSTPKTPRSANGFALYVKENYKTTKEKNSGLKHAEIMKLLGNQFASMKVGPSLQV